LLFSQVPAFRNRWQPTFSYKLENASEAERKKELMQQLLKKRELGVAGFKLDKRKGVIEVLAPKASSGLRNTVASFLEGLGIRNRWAPA
jgi:hypothetical protein